MTDLNKNSVGLTLGVLLAFLHLVWVILVAVGFAQPLMTFALSLHNISLVYSMTPVAANKAIGLIVVTFIVGYIVGYLFASIWNRLHR